MNSNTPTLLQSKANSVLIHNTISRESTSGTLTCIVALFLPDGAVRAQRCADGLGGLADSSARLIVEKLLTVNGFLFAGERCRADIGSVGE